MISSAGDRSSSAGVSGLPETGYQAHAVSGATSEEFAEFMVTRAPAGKAIIDEWFLGKAYSRVVLLEPDFEALVVRYQVEQG